MTGEESIQCLEDLILKKKLIRIIFSEPNQGEKVEWEKVIVRPVQTKEQELIQFEKFKGNKSYHFNVEIEKIHEEMAMSVREFRQIYIQSDGKDYHIRRKGEKFSCKSKENNCSVSEVLEHDRSKKYILPEGQPIDFLIYLGLMSEEGKIFKKSYPKYRQINKYLEFIENTIEELQQKNHIHDSIRILDFGCGKSYLTFALYYYLKKIKKISFEMIGLDLKEDVIKKCNQITKELRYENLKFLTGNIKDFEEVKEVDLIFSLHACDNATDYSILKALELKAKAILAVPCCQHEFFHKISEEKKSPFFNQLSSLGKHGILLERFSSLATDAYRASFLEMKGYRTQVMEFIEMEHTPKNILIKAIYEGKVQNREKKEKEHERLIAFLGIKPLLK